jgi:[amino group carrier protein]-lysine/ornithine hydrolase
MTETENEGRGTPIKGAEAIALVQSLVSIPSPSKHESEAVRVFVSWMAEHGFDTEIDAVGNAIGRRGRGPNRIVLLGHIDTFPGELPVERKGHWLYGRGSVDAKGPLSAFACAAASVDLRDDWQVVVIGAVEEESPTSRGARHVLAEMEAPNFCVIGEPSGWDRVTLGYKGALQGVLRWQAEMAHSAGPQRLPAEQAVDIWNAISRRCDGFNRTPRRGFERLEPALQHISTADAGAFSNVEMRVGFRLPPSTTAEEVALEMTDVVQGILPQVEAHLLPSGVESPTEGIGLWFIGGEEAYKAPKSTDLVRIFLSAIREKGGGPRFVVKTGTSDMNVVGPTWGPSILAYGAGDSSLDHTPDERLDLEEYLLSIEVLRNVLSQIQEDAAVMPREGGI